MTEELDQALSEIPIGEEPVTEPNPIGTKREADDDSIDDAIDAAFAEDEGKDDDKEVDKKAEDKKKADAKAKSEKPKPEPKKEKVEEKEAEDDEDSETDDDPDLAAKEKEGAEKDGGDSKASSGESDDDSPPSRFRLNDRKEWDDASPQLKAEVKRALTEMEGGLTKHKAAAEAYEPLKDLDQYAKSTGTNLRDAVLRLHQAEQQLFHKDPQVRFSALNDLVQKTHGMSIHQMAAQIAKMPQDKVSQQKDQQIAQLTNTVSQLQQSVQNMVTQSQQEKSTALNRHIQDFAQQHPRFEELRPVMAKLIQSGVVGEDLSEAYAAADRLTPGSGNASTSSRALTQDDTNPEALKPNGNGLKPKSKQIGGTNGGSLRNPSPRLLSQDEALDAAFAQYRN